MVFPFFSFLSKEIWLFWKLDWRDAVSSMNGSMRTHESPEKSNDEIHATHSSRVRKFLTEETETFILNIITVVGFCLYAWGIYLHVAIRGKEWGNVAVDLSIQVLGPLLGVLMVVMLGGIILFFTLGISQFRAVNVFLCWFWMLSLYQCAINSFLEFHALPNEPINLFFKWLFPSLWYPVKEICFILISVPLTVTWLKKVGKKAMKKLDLILITILSIGLVLSTLASQLFLINSNILTWSWPWWRHRTKKHDLLKNQAPFINEGVKLKSIDLHFLTANDDYPQFHH